MKDNVKFYLGPHNLTSERIDFFIRKISDRYKNIEIKRYYGSEFNPEAFRDEIFENSLFVECRIIIVHQIEHIEKKVWTEFIFPSLEKISENVFALFEGLSVKVKTGEYAVETIEDAENLLKKIYRKSWQKRLSTVDFYEISKFLRQNPYEFALVIGVIEKHLENLVIRKLISEQEFIRRLKILSELDFNLKSGKISSEPGWEVLLLSLLDVSG